MSIVVLFGAQHAHFTWSKSHLCKFDVCLYYVPVVFSFIVAPFQRTPTFSIHKNQQQQWKYKCLLSYKILWVRRRRKKTKSHTLAAGRCSLRAVVRFWFMLISCKKYFSIRWICSSCTGRRRQAQASISLISFETYNNSKRVEILSFNLCFIICHFIYESFKS